MIKSIEFDNNELVKLYDFKISSLSLQDFEIQVIDELLVSVNSTDHHNTTIRSNKPEDIVFVKITTCNNTTMEIGFDWKGDKVYFLTFNPILGRIVEFPKITTVFADFDHIYYDTSLEVYVDDTHHSFYVGELLKTLTLIELRDNWEIRLTNEEKEELRVGKKISNYFLNLVNDTFKDYDPYKNYIYKIAKAILCFPGKDSEFNWNSGYNMTEAIVLLYLCSMAMEDTSGEEVIIITRLELDRWDRDLSWLIMDTIENLGINLIYKRLL